MRLLPFAVLFLFTFSLAVALASGGVASIPFTFVVDRTPPTVSVKALDLDQFPKEIQYKTVSNSKISCIGGLCRLYVECTDENISGPLNITVSVDYGSITKDYTTSDVYSESIGDLYSSSNSSYTFISYGDYTNTGEYFWYFSEAPGSTQDDNLKIRCEDTAGNVVVKTYTIHPTEYFIQMVNYGEWGRERGFEFGWYGSNSIYASSGSWYFHNTPVPTYKICAAFQGGGKWHDDPAVIQFKGYNDLGDFPECVTIKQADHLSDNMDYGYCWTAGSWEDLYKAYKFKAYAGNGGGSLLHFDGEGCVSEHGLLHDDYVDYAGFKVYLTEFIPYYYGLIFYKLLGVSGYYLYNYSLVDKNGRIPVFASVCHKDVFAEHHCTDSSCSCSSDIENNGTPKCCLYTNNVYGYPDTSGSFFGRYIGQNPSFSKDRIRMCTNMTVYMKDMNGEEYQGETCYGEVPTLAFSDECSST